MDRRTGTRGHRQPVPSRSHRGRTHTIAQANNNALVFSGLGLGVAVVRARRVNDAMIAAAADTIAALAHPTGRRGLAATSDRPADRLSRRRHRSSQRRR
jgi:malic enzyme